MLVAENLISTSFWAFSLVTFSLVLGWIGIRYTDSELLRASNEQILHNLKEGVIIFDDTNAHL